MTAGQLELPLDDAPARLARVAASTAAARARSVEEWNRFAEQQNRRAAEYEERTARQTWRLERRRVIIRRESAWLTVDRMPPRCV